MTNEIRMTFSLCKFRLLLGCVALVALTAEARIVHTPAEALSNPGGVNPYTDANGGVWSVSRRQHANDALSAEALLPKHFTYVEGLVGFSPETSKAYDIPLACVNATNRDITLGGCCGIRPGGLYLHPGDPTVSVRSRIVVAFTVPRNGWYSLSARFCAGDLTAAGFVDTTIVADGAVLFQEELYRAGDGNPRLGTPYSFSRRFLRKGAEIAFAVGSGWSESKPSKSYFNDSTTLDVEITEEETIGDGDLLGTAELGLALNALTVDTAGDAGTFQDPSGLGAWTLQARARSANPVFGYDAPEYEGSATAINAAHEQDLGTHGVIFTPAGADLPIVQSYGADDVAVSVKYSSPVRIAGDNVPYDEMTPGEAIVHPGTSSKACVFVTFLPSEAGSYLISVDARDLAKRDKTAIDTDGVDVTLFVGGENHAACRVSTEVNEPWCTIQTRILYLQVGEPVVLKVDSRGGNNSDGLGTFFRIMRVAESVTKEWNAARAICESMTAALTGGQPPADPTTFNPFMSQDATWKLGKASVPGVNGNFELLTKWSSYGVLQGWEAASVGVPLVCGNAQTEPFNNAKSTLMGGTGTWLYPGEFVIHPNKQVYGVVRFIAPADGVYDVVALCRDLNGTGTDYGDGNGVICHVVANGNYAATGVANVRSGTLAIQSAHLTPERLYLKEGDVIDLCIAPNRTGATNSDSTSVRERIFAAQTLKVVSVDFTASGASAFSGRGRVGFSANAWQSLEVGAGCGKVEKNGCQDEDANETRVSVSLSAADGATLSPAEGGSGLFAGGVSAADDTIVDTWRVTGLIPRTSYRFYLYGTGGATFAAGEARSVLNRQWFTPRVAEYAVLEAVSDEKGVVSGTFSAASGEAGTFSALQIEGPAFADPPKGCVIIFK